MATLKARLDVIEAKLDPKRISVIFMRNNDTAPLDDYRRTHGGKDPDICLTPIFAVTFLYNIPPSPHTV